jgi:hypothetical protein
MGTYGMNMLNTSQAYIHRACSNTKSKTSADCKLAIGLLSVLLVCIIYILLQEIRAGQVIHSKKTR